MSTEKWEWGCWILVLVSFFFQLGTSLKQSFKKKVDGGYYVRLIDTYKRRRDAEDSCCTGEKCSARKFITEVSCRSPTGIISHIDYLYHVCV